MTFEKKFKHYLSRIERIRWQVEDFTEEATKTALIMPFFSVLGYDVFDTNEFILFQQEDPHLYRRGMNCVPLDKT